MFDATDLWYIGRGSGLVAVVVLTVTVVLGMLSTVPGRRGGPRRRVLLQGVHRQLTLAGVVLIVLHIGCLVADRWVDVDLVDTLLPFGSTYRRFWLGLGTLAVDLMVVVVVTSLLRQRMAPAAWRAVHWLAYATWALAVAHGLMAGTDARARPVQLLAAVCVNAVLLALIARVQAGRAPVSPGETIPARP